METIETLYYGTFNGQRIQSGRSAPKSATLIRCDYINEGGLMGEPVNLYFTGKKYYFKIMPEIKF